MKKTFSILFCALFFGVCLLFSLGMIIPGSSNAAENKSTFPGLISSEGINHDFGSELEEWFSENFAFRNTVVDIFSDLKMNVLSEGNSQVIAGKENFLFFADTLDSYIGENPMTEEELDAAAKALLDMQNEALESGAKFLFVCAPNKNTVYGDMMPDRYVRCERPDLDRLYEKLDALGVEYIDMRSTLEAAADKELVYHKRDSHWNGAGAYVAADMIANAFGVPMADLSGRGPSFTDNFEGDLDALLYPGDVKYDEDVTYDFDGLYVYTTAYTSPMDITISTRSGGHGRLLIFRDSFANALIPYLASSFSEVRFERTVPYRMSLAESMDADFVVVEIAERNIRNLADHGASAEE